MDKIKEGMITGKNSWGPNNDPKPERKWSDPDVYIRYIYATKLCLEEELNGMNFLTRDPVTLKGEYLAMKKFTIAHDAKNEIIKAQNLYEETKQ